MLPNQNANDIWKMVLKINFSFFKKNVTKFKF